MNTYELDALLDRILDRLETDRAIRATIDDLLCEVAS